MPWKVVFETIDGEKNTSNFVGDATATYTDEKGVALVSFSARIKSDDGVQDFISRAKAEKALLEKESTANDQIALKLESALNS